MKRLSFVLSIAILFFAPFASADSVNVVTGDASWHPWQTPSTAQVMNSGWGPAQNLVPGTAFWNNWSIDGAPNHACNIGYWLSGTGGCTANVIGGAGFYATSPSTTASYLGNAGTGFGFTPDAGGSSVSVTLKVESSSYSATGTNEIGWFNVASPSLLNPLFGGTVAAPNVELPGTSATFVPSGPYGFYLKSPSGTYLSTGSGDSRTHFAVFQLSGSDHYLFGLEDMNNGLFADWDYNDMALEVQMTPVPEPASLLLLGTGLAGLFGVARRRRAR